MSNSRTIKELKIIRLNQGFTPGFTMVELLMAIALVSILAAIAGVQYIDFRTEAKISMSEKKLYELRDALSGNPEFVANGNYVKPGLIVDVGAVPSSLSALISQGSYSSFNMYEKRGWRGPYINSSVSGWSLDAWGTAISYYASSRVIKSCGKDAICDGANATDDISVSF